MADGWFVSNGKKQLGPFTPAKMRALAQAGKLRAAMRISRDGATWIKASESEFLDGPLPDSADGAGDRTKTRTTDLDPLPDPFADDPSASDDDGEDEDSAPVPEIPDPADDEPGTADDDSVIDSGPAVDDDSGVIDSGPADDDDDSGVIASIPDTADDDDSGVIVVPYEDDATAPIVGDAADDADDPTEPGEPYRYRARGPDGREVIAELRAESTAQAFRRVRERGLDPIMALPKQGFAGWPDRAAAPTTPPGASDRLRARAAAAATAIDRVLLALARVQGGAAARVAFADRSRACAIVLLHAFLAGAGLAIAGRLGDTAAGLLAAIGGLAILTLAFAVAWSAARAAIDRAQRAFGLLPPAGPNPHGAPTRARSLAALPGVLLGATLFVAGVYDLAPSTFAWTDPPVAASWLALVLAATVDAADPFGVLDLGADLDLVPISLLGCALVAAAQAAMLAGLALLVVRELAERLPLRAALAALGPAPTRAAATAALARWIPPPVELLARELARAPDPTRRRALASAFADLPAELSHPALVALAADDRARAARADVAWAVGRIAAPGGAERLAAWLLDPAWYPHRGTIIEALVATCDRHGAPGLVAFLADANHHDLHAPAARALVALDDPEQREALWALLEADRPREVRTIAAAGLGRIGGEDDLPLLDAVLDDEPDPQVARWVRRALESISNPESRGTLAALEVELDALTHALEADADTPDPDATVRAPAVTSDDPGGA